MDEVVIIGNNKRMKTDTVGFRKNLSPRLHHGTQEDAMPRQQAEVIVMSDDSDPGVDNKQRCPAALVNLLDSSSMRNKGEAYQMQYENKSHDKTKEFVKRKSDLSKKERTPHKLNDEYNNSNSGNNIEKKSVMVDKEDSAEAAGEQEETFVPSVKYNFENPLMAISYNGEFKTSAENFTKGCKWLVNLYI